MSSLFVIFSNFQIKIRKKKYASFSFTKNVAYFNSYFPRIPYLSYFFLCEIFKIKLIQLSCLFFPLSSQTFRHFMGDYFFIPDDCSEYANLTQDPSIFISHEQLNRSFSQESSVESPSHSQLRCKFFTSFIFHWS